MQAGRWSRDELADRATLALAAFVEANPDLPVEELDAWSDLEVTVDHVRTFENGPTDIFTSHLRRGRLLGVCVAGRMNTTRTRVCRVLAPRVRGRLAPALTGVRGPSRRSR